MKIEGNFYRIVSIFSQSTWKVNDRYTRLDTTPIFRDPSNSAIEFPSNRMGADRALRETMEKMAISQTNGTGRKEGRYLRSGSGNCQVQE